ncbi:Inositol polyphosphate 5-phosphatase [Trachipleistophora hominis]|uniref:Inositol polyphosphate 5-phosphatase n=1 Tax=Trachipleistophora hominis TaxID=72359 RepID=L7JRP8_TRAHO|nr:Inositol polyphosphate 5-phosphatase [Trachipleistophora hominis]
MNILILTWNVQKNKNYLVDLHYMLKEKKADTIYIALQEAHDFTVPWAIQKFFMKLFFKAYKYREIERFCGLVTIILSKYRITAVNTFVPFPNLYYNKGAVVTNLGINYTNILLVNLHLHHGVINEARRVNQMKMVLRSIEGRFSYIFVCGDFNTRVDVKKIPTCFDLNEFVMLSDWCNRTCREGPLNADADREWACAYNLHMDKFKKADQMNAFKSIFCLDEFDVKFLPSYKYHARTDAYNLKQTPSWCDRILFKTVNEIECLFYGSNMLVNTSDHKPVMALYQIRDGFELKNMNKKKKKAKYACYAGYTVQFTYNNFILIVIGLTAILWHFFGQLLCD